MAVYLAVGMLLLTFVAPDFTIHRRAAVTAHTKWVKNPTPETQAVKDREFARSFTIQVELSALGSLIITGIACASF